jgi:hypothetical protein
MTKANTTLRTTIVDRPRQNIEALPTHFTAGNTGLSAPFVPLRIAFAIFFASFCRGSCAYSTSMVSAAAAYIGRKNNCCKGPWSER